MLWELGSTLHTLVSGASEVYGLMYSWYNSVDKSTLLGRLCGMQVPSLYLY